MNSVKENKEETRIGKMITRYEKPLVAGLLLVFFLMAFLSMRNDAAVVDEVSHLTAGYMYIKMQDYRYNEEHPPLVKMIAAIPLLALNPELPLVSLDKNKQPDQWEFAKEFLYSGVNNPDQLFFWARLPMIFIGILLGYYVYRWSKELYGTKAALFALTLYIFSPLIIGHTKFVHTDIPLATAMFITVYYFSKWLQHPIKKYLIVTGVWLGIANAVKFTGIYLFPILTGIYSYYYYDKILHRDVTNIKKNERKKELGDAIKNGCIMLIIAAAVVSATYFFVYTPRYIDGMKVVIEHAKIGHETFLFGEHSVQGWWYYFPLAFLIKTPIAFLMFMGIASVGMFYKRRELKTRGALLEVILLLPPGVYFIAFVFNHINIGVRHILPIMPFLFVWISEIINKSCEEKKTKILFSTSIIVLLLWYVIASIGVLPYSLAYFNEFVGQNNGHKYLLDSNIDWGQDGKRLQQWLDERKMNNKNTRVTIFTNEVYNGKPYRFKEEKSVTCQPTAGIIAVSVNKLADVSQNQNSCAAWLLKYQPFERIGYSIFVYNISDEKLVQQQQFCITRCTESCTESNKTFSDYVYKERCLCVCE